MLVFWSPRGPRVPMAWGGCVGAAGYPMGCQIGRLTRHETPLARPSQATKISKPNRFAYPFRSRPRGVCGSPILNLRPHHTSSYRDTADLGVGVRPRGRKPDTFYSDFYASEDDESNEPESRQNAANCSLSANRTTTIYYETLSTRRPNGGKFLLTQRRRLDHHRRPRRRRPRLPPIQEKTIRSVWTAF